MPIKEYRFTPPLENPTDRDIEKAEKGASIEIIYHGVHTNIPLTPTMALDVDALGEGEIYINPTPPTEPDPLVVHTDTNGAKTIEPVKTRISVHVGPKNTEYLVEETKSNWRLVKGAVLYVT